MATRMAFRYVSRRFSSSGRILSEEEKAAENVYIKKVEQGKLEKIARKGPKPEEKAATSTGGSATVSDAKSTGSVSDAKSTGSVSDAKSTGSTSSTSGVSTDKYRNYAVVAGVVTGLGAMGWYLLSREKKSEEIQD